MLNVLLASSIAHTSNDNFYNFDVSSSSDQADLDSFFASDEEGYYEDVPSTDDHSSQKSSSSSKKKSSQKKYFDSPKWNATARNIDKRYKDLRKQRALESKQTGLPQEDSFDGHSYAAKKVFSKKKPVKQEQVFEIQSEPEILHFDTIKKERVLESKQTGLPLHRIDFFA